VKPFDLRKIQYYAVARVSPFTVLYAGTSEGEATPFLTMGTALAVGTSREEACNRVMAEAARIAGLPKLPSDLAEKMRRVQDIVPKVSTAHYARKSATTDVATTE